MNPESEPDQGSDGDTGGPPNLLLLITDQQRVPMHWPAEPGWVERLTPADAELARTGITFRNATCASAMCSPSRASLLTGRWPSRHGVELTLTQGGAQIKPENGPATLRLAIAAVLRGEIGLLEAVKVIFRSATRRPDAGPDERELDPTTPNIATILGRAGYRTVIKGKWHLTQPVDGDGWSEADAMRLASEFGLEGWVPPDAGENIEPSHFGGGSFAGRSKEGYDEDFCRQVEDFLADPPPEPWALIASMVNPHDVLAYPSSYSEGGYGPGDWADLGEVDLPATARENLKGKPKVHVVQRFGQTSFLGPVTGEEEMLDYCRFYAHLQLLVDEKVGRIVEALGDPEDPGSLRSKTLVVRTSDHGEMGMAHGGLRQKTFNAYDETIRVPLVFSNPQLFPGPAESSRPATLCDVLPTLASIAGIDTAGDGITGRDLTGELAREAVPSASGFDSLLSSGGSADEGSAPAHFTYDDHQSGTAYTNVAPQPNRIRAVRSEDAMYAVYFDHGDPGNREYELYNLGRDPLQIRNLVDVSTGAVIDPADEPLRAAMAGELDVAMDEHGTRVHAGK